MTELLTASEMQRHEAALFAKGALTPEAAMEAAGAAVAQACLALAGSAVGRRAVVLCGPGNNGGDGYVTARHLAQAGWQVRVAAVEPAVGAGPAAAMRARWCAIGPVSPLVPGAIAGADLVVDALFGIGLRRPIAPDTAVGAVLADLAAAGPGRPKVVAVDIPSGLCADTGHVLGGAAPADLTVTFGHPKLGHYLAQGPRLCGRLQVAAVGLDGPAGAAARLVGPPQAALLSKPEWGALGQGAHKYDHGHALVLAGGVGTGGAARLAAHAALRIGAGLVTLAPPQAALAENAARLDAVMLRVVEDAGSLAALLADPRWRALVLGPGLGAMRARALVPVALAQGCATVLDADALSAFANDPGALFGLLHQAVVLTPHGGEFARLFPDLASAMRPDADGRPPLSKAEATRQAAARAGCTVLLKGPDTVIAAPDGMVAVHAAAYGRAAPWLATAGAGDVLAGLIAGLMARGLPPVSAAEAAVWLHVEAARSQGPGLIAEDLPKALPRVLSALGVV